MTVKLFHERVSPIKKTNALQYYFDYALHEDGIEVLIVRNCRVIEGRISQPAYYAGSGWRSTVVMSLRLHDALASALNRSKVFQEAVTTFVTQPLIRAEEHPNFRHLFAERESAVPVVNT